MTEFTVNRKPCRLTASSEGLVIEKHSKTRTELIEKRTISIKSILAVEYLDNKCPCVRVHHVVKHTNKRLRLRKCDLTGEKSDCLDIKDVLQTALNGISRPKRLLVFVNPKSGHQKAVKIYNSKVLPLFNRAGVKPELIVTSRAGQPREVLSDRDSLSLIHGIVSIGGDGMFSECVNGLLSRLQRDSQVNMDDPDSDITPSNIPIGIVPAGSGNYLVNYIHGTQDVETAVLKIILGDHHMSNVVSLHQGQTLSCYASLLVEFGLVGDMMHDCESYRWLGPRRYSFVPIATMSRRKTVDVQVEYLPEEKVKTPRISRQFSSPANRSPNTSFRSRINSMPGDTAPEKKADWKKLNGAVYGVDTYVVTQKEKQGSLVPRFADNALTVWTTDKCGLSEHVEQLTRLQRAKAGFLDFDFIKSVRTTRYRVTLSSAKTTMDASGQRHLQKNFYINADGQAIRLDTPEFEVKLHHAAMPIYGKVDG